jgi:hypothetical protein
MKKSRILRAIKKADTTLIKKYNMVSFGDEKGQTYVLGTEDAFRLQINEAASYALHKLLDIIDDEKVKDKILKKLQNDKK